MVTSDSLLAYAAAFFSGAMAVVALFRKRHSVASVCFVVGMVFLALDSALTGLSIETVLPENVVYWQTLALIAKSFLPGVWLCFSLSYSRGNYGEFLRKWRFPLAVAFLLPPALVLGFRQTLIQGVHPLEADPGWWLDFGDAAQLLNTLILVATVLILTNIEATFRAAIGTMRWRIKFLVIGLAVIFGARIYTGSQALLFSRHSLGLANVESSALLIGCVLIAVAYLRSGFSEIDVYPSTAVLRSSITVLLAGGYLFVVGVLAQIVARLGGVGNFQAQAFVVLLGSAVLAVLLVSDRLRQNVQRFVSRHFKTPQHDFRKVWTLSTQCVSSVRDQSGLCTATVKLVSETFNVLSATIWLFDEKRDRLMFGASTAQVAAETNEPNPNSTVRQAILTGLQKRGGPFDLENIKEEWGENVRQLTATKFRTGGNRICAPVAAGERVLGLIILADRVNGVRYTLEEFDLLKCITDQMAAGLLNLRLTQQLMLGKELEAFQTMSAFFVHDLKNAASSLSLMLQNLPIHFDDPAFREDALRGIGSTVNRINSLIDRLSILRHKLEIKSEECDLNQLVEEVLAHVDGLPKVEWVKALQPLPTILADREQLRTVFTNLLMNAGDAVGAGGRITVATSQGEGRAVLSVADNGCGMSAQFLRDSLFRPFNTTKKKGLGIGMFQSKMIVEAHRGNIQVESEPGTGTTFRVLLPLNPHANET